MANIKVFSDSGHKWLEINMPISDERLRIIMADIVYTTQSNEKLESPSIPNPAQYKLKGEK